MQHRITKCIKVVHSLKTWNGSDWEIPTKKSIYEGSKSRLKSRNAGYHSAQNILFSSLLQKDVKMQNYNFSCCLYGCEAWSLASRQEHRLRVLEYRMLRLCNSGVEKTTYREALCSTLLSKYYSCDKIKKNGMGGPCGTYGWQRCIQGFGGETWLWGGHLEDIGIDGRIIFKWIFRKKDGEAWILLIWLAIGTGRGRLWMQWWTLELT
jgi:hypothetical protein